MAVHYSFANYGNAYGVKTKSLLERRKNQLRLKQLANKAPARHRKGFNNGKGNVTFLAHSASAQKVYFNAAYSESRFANFRDDGGYLQREAASKDGETSYGYNQHSNQAPIAKTMHAWQVSGDPRYWKFKISPPRGCDIDLTKLCKEVEKRINAHWGAEVEQIYVNHYNTATKHSHVAMRGIDVNGTEVILYPLYVSEGIRHMVEEIATDMIGLRLPFEIELERANLLEVSHPIEMDKELLSLAKANQGEIEIEGEPFKSRSEERARVNKLTRLTYLNEIGLAERKPGSSHTWLIDMDLRSKLETMARSKDLKKRLIEGQADITNPDADFVVDQIDDGKRVTGRLVGFNLEDTSKSRYFLIESIDGKVRYIDDIDHIQINSSRKPRVGEIVSVLGTTNPATRELQGYLFNHGKLADLVQDESDNQLDVDCFYFIDAKDGDFVKKGIERSDSLEADDAIHKDRKEVTFNLEPVYTGYFEHDYRNALLGRMKKLEQQKAIEPVEYTRDKYRLDYDIALRIQIRAQQRELGIKTLSEYRMSSDSKGFKDAVRNPDQEIVYSGEIISPRLQNKLGEEYVILKSESTRHFAIPIQTKQAGLFKKGDKVEAKSFAWRKEDEINVSYRLDLKDKDQQLESEYNKDAGMEL